MPGVKLQKKRPKALGLKRSLTGILSFSQSTDKKTLNAPYAQMQVANMTASGPL